MAQKQSHKRRKSDGNADKLEGDKCDERSKCISEKCISIMAWMLFAIGLCIIATTVILATTQDMYLPVEEFSRVDSNTDIFLEIDRNKRLIDYDFIDKLNTNFSGCEERKCRLMCRNASDVYSDVHDAMVTSDCSVIDFMIIDKQQFPHGILRHSWLTTKQKIRELTLTSSNVTRIRSEAFNSPIFSATFMLYLHNLKLGKVEGGALLGLKSLKCLTIDTPITYLDRAFFQPVQTTLAHLKLNAGLHVTRNSDLFGIVTQLIALEYVDLSNNNFNGPITETMFLSTPNLRHLIINRSRVLYIEERAFHHLAGKLRYLSLTHNYMISLTADTILPLITGGSRPLVNLGGNNWVCDCNLRGFVEVYKQHRTQFLDLLFCKAPHPLYGMSLYELDADQLHCDASYEDSQENNNNGLVKKDSTTSTVTSTITLEKTTSQAFDMVTKPQEKVFHLRCTGSSDLENSRSTASNPFIYLDEHDVEEDNARESKGNQQNDKEPEEQKKGDEEEDYLNTFFELDGPTHDFRLEVLENRSVEVIIQGLFCGSPTVVWFSDQIESLSVVGGNGVLETSIDYECFKYNGAVCPNLIIDDLVEDTTYTFCVIPSGENAMTPLNCLPLYVPHKNKKTDDIWISAEDKQFTIGMICLILVVSAFFGAVIAYFGIKTYPDLLEGSKNVLVVKKSNQTCYVSTISEEDYQKKSSMKKKPLGTSVKKNCRTTPLSETSTIQAPSLSISAKHLDRVCSLKSSSTCFEDSFFHVPYGNDDDEYEMPKEFEKGFIYGYTNGRSVPNNYEVNPGSPPPLPKRNSNPIYDTNDVTKLD